MSRLETGRVLSASRITNLPKKGKYRGLGPERLAWN